MTEPLDSPVPSDSAIRGILRERIDQQRQSVGLVVGVLEPSGRRILAYGRLGKDDRRTPKENSVFEIGSATKVFTSLVLADMVDHGEISLSDPAEKYLPPGIKMPRRGGRQITLEELATHRSGLPRLPSNLSPKNQANPYADYSIDQLYQFLSSCRLTRDIGSQYLYSNLGGGLLGHLLARRAGVSYEQLVRTRIADPLGLNSTRITLSEEMKAQLAEGYDRALHPTPMWDLPTLAGAGALRSTARDLLTFLAAVLGYVPSPLAAAMVATLAVRYPTGIPGLEIALAWHISTRDGKEVIWHNGGTGGFRSFLGYEPNERIAVVVLSNAGTAAGVDDIGQHLLNPNVALSRPTRRLWPKFRGFAFPWLSP
ncbi:MAG TPA: serine hydrolase domain-containing protein [Terriglobales bacterium]|nr:serine hydrolase domain-containing protein [Terriglobales bacterium]